MDISNITKSYRMNDLKVTPDQLILDPFNPRISLDIDQKLDYTPDQLVSEAVQKYVLSIINKQEHHISDLINGLKTSGYLKGTSPIIVKKVKFNKYIILEGNRRVTAIKHLLEERQSLNTSILNTLESLPVTEFIFQDIGTFYEQEVIDILLGSLHLKGTLDWGPIEKAAYIYKSYMRSFKSEFGNSLNFTYLKSHADKIASFYNLKTNDVKRAVTIKRIYDQLKKEMYPVRQDHYSLIELAVTNNLIGKKFFGLNGAFKFSKEGLEYFANLCVVEDRPIRNPKLFKDFVTIYKLGTEYELNQVYLNIEPINIVLNRVKKRNDKKKFLTQLKQIKSKLDNLMISDYRGTIQEIKTANDIKEIVKHKLSRLTKLN